jgi:methylenetetrahydrofolate reductase (NADPH)
MSSLAASVLLLQAGVEPVYQLVTRDRNRIALQSDLLGAAALGIRNVLCLSGYHQTLTDSPESANAYDLDSTQADCHD